MQEVSGADLTDLNEVAQMSSIDMAMNQGLHSFPRKSFAPQIPVIAHRAKAPGGYSPVCCSHAPLANRSGAHAIERQTGVAPDYGFANMMIDCSCVCHPRFQNEVIGG